MKANELRIGNWVEDEDDSQERFQVRTIVEGEGYTKGMHFINGRWSEDLKPIPLIPEILEAAGFEKQHWNASGCNVWQQYNWRIAKSFTRNDSEWSLWHKQMNPPTWSLSSFEYVHQLQNLYFALTGVELTINLHATA